MSKEEDHRMAMIKAFEEKKRDYDPAKAATGNFRSLVNLSLNDLVSAGNMSLDRRLPECLSNFAGEIIRTDAGVPFRPKLRRLVKNWLDDEKEAMEWLDYFKKNENEIDLYLKKLLYPLLITLTGKKNE